MVESWNCHKCTFYHAYPAQRCGMCNELRVSKQQMRDFVAGVRTGGGQNGGGDSCGGGESVDAVRNRNFGPQHRRGQDAQRPATANEGGNNDVRPRSAGGPPRPPGAVVNPYSSSSGKRPSTANNPYARPKVGIDNRVRMEASMHRKELNAGNNARGGQDSNGENGADGAMRQDNNVMQRPPQTPNNTQYVNPQRQGSQQKSTVRNPYASSAMQRNNSHQNGQVMRPQHPQHHTEQQSSNAQRPTSSYQNQQQTNRPGTSNGAMSSTAPPLRNSTNRQQHPTSDQTRRPLKLPALPQGPNPSSTAASSSSQQQRRQPPQQQQQHRQKQSSQRVDLHNYGFNARYEEGHVPLCAETSHNWIYPQDDKFPERVYQREIAETAIMHNTLVSLPTGLGKTLIAAVAMYNYYRWFPTGKVVFCCPTRPLVTQQIGACYNIMGMPEYHTAEISGKKKPVERERMWRVKRAFFCTPQTLVKDIEDGRCDAKSIVCVVLDEAHKATGEFAYAVLIRLMKNAGAKYRLICLSATPGKDIKSIQSVIDTLSISKIECRTEDDPAVKQYIHEREDEIIIVRQPDIIKSLDRKLEELIAPIWAPLRDVDRRLQCNNSDSITPWVVNEVSREFYESTGSYHLQKKFNVLRNLVEIRQALKNHGVQMARDKLERACDKNHMTQMLRLPEFQSLLDDMRVACGSTQDEMDGAVSKHQNNPKFSKLAEVLDEHFSRKLAVNESTRVIVFSQFRESVAGIVRMLSSRNSSLIKPSQFVGQAKASKKSSKGGGTNSNNTEIAGMNQKEQQRVLRQFRDGIYNVLVCTSVAEEGLDIGEVDLIINFDVLKSPIRNIQRSGRTGRKRNGRVVFLIAEGQEERSYMQQVTNAKTLARALKNPLVFKLCPGSPMVPCDQGGPMLHRQRMNVNQFRLSQVGGHTPKMGAKGGGSRKRHGGKSNKLIDINWRLDPSQERERVNRFGRLPHSSCREYESSKRHFPPSLKRKYLNSRDQSVCNRMLRKGDRTKTTSVGKSSNILQMLEKKYSISDYADREGPNEGRGNDRERPEGNIDPDGELECGSVGLGSDASVVCAQNSESAAVSTETLLDIFGPVVEDERKTVDCSKIEHLFDSPSHRNCSVTAPPGMAIDDSDDDTGSSDSVSSAQSEVSMNDDEDLLAFFERDDSVIFRPSGPSEEERNVMQTPFSDNGSYDDFGGNDNLDFGTPGDTVLANTDVADASKCLESMLVIGGEEAAPYPNNSSPNQTVSRETVPACEKETMNNQQSNKKPRTSEQAAASSILPIHGVDPQLGKGGNQQRNCNGLNGDNSPNMQPPVDENMQSIADAPVNPLGNDDNSSQGLPPPNEESVNQNGDEADKESQAQEMAHFRLPTPPPSSSDESDNDSSSYNDQHNVDKQSLQQNLFVADESMEEVVGKKEVSFFQLPTQFSSSSSEAEDSDDGDDSTNSDDNPPNKMVDGIRPEEKSMAEEYSARMPCQTLADTPDSRHVHFKPNPKMAPSDDLTDSPVKASLSVHSSKKSGANWRMSLESLADTPISSRSNVQPRKSLDSLTDTPAQAPKNAGQRRKRLRPAQLDNEEKEVPEAKSTEKKIQRKERMKKRIEEKYRCRFLDCEAANDDSEESDEEEAVRRLEEEELSHDSFINDTSQLGYTQDDLDNIHEDIERVNAGDEGEDALMHRQYDNQQHRNTLFKTPVLNRRMRNPESEDRDTQSSQKGLGNMNFIRSVLEHAAGGGEADELEEEYHRIAEENGSTTIDSPIQPSKSSGFGQQPNNATVLTTDISCAPFQVGLEAQPQVTNAAVGGIAPASSSAAVAPPNAAASKQIVLTAEQRAMIEAKRQEALRRRQQKMHEKANLYAK